jgi:hypothetical protein
MDAVVVAYAGYRDFRRILQNEPDIFASPED